MPRPTRSFLVVASLLVGGLAGGALVKTVFPGGGESQGLYLDLLKRTLTDIVYEEDPRRLLLRIEGRDWPGRAHTMIGLRRLDNLQSCIEDVLRRHVPGDFIECGAWRGGATIFMRAALKAHGVTDRKVWASDSFEGLPPPDPAQYPADEGTELHTHDFLAVSLERVQSNFARYGLLDDRVVFLKGWFKDTLPGAKIDRLAILRVDGDMYESTMDALEPLYPKLSVGGYVIIDDVGAMPSCAKAVADFRARHRISTPIRDIDGVGAYWRKEQGQ